MYLYFILCNIELIIFSIWITVRFEQLLSGNTKPANSRLANQNKAFQRDV